MCKILGIENNVVRHDVMDWDNTIYNFNKEVVFIGDSEVEGVGITDSGEAYNYTFSLGDIQCIWKTTLDKLPEAVRKALDNPS